MKAAFVPALKLTHTHTHAHIQTHVLQRVSESPFFIYPNPWHLFCCLRLGNTFSSTGSQIESFTTPRAQFMLNLFAISFVPGISGGNPLKTILKPEIRFMKGIAQLSMTYVHG